MPMRLFHSTTQLYRINQNVGPFLENNFIHNRIKARNLYHIEDFLELNRPHNKTSRLSAVYAFAEIEYCLAFSHFQSADIVRVYEVEMQNPSSSPMCLVNTFNDTILSEL